MRLDSQARTTHSVDDEESSPPFHNVVLLRLDATKLLHCILDSCLKR